MTLPTKAARYEFGCAGMFMLGQRFGTSDDLDEAIVACGSPGAPTGCEILDTVTGAWLGPTCWEEIDEARARLEARAHAS